MGEVVRVRHSSLPDLRASRCPTNRDEALNYKATPLYASQISNFEQGKREPPLMVLLAYARLAGVSIECLVDDKIKLPD